jgi:hypothetical protein
VEFVNFMVSFVIKNELLETKKREQMGKSEDRGDKGGGGEDKQPGGRMKESQESMPSNDMKHTSIDNSSGSGHESLYNLQDNIQDNPNDDPNDNIQAAKIQTAEIQAAIDSGICGMDKGSEGYFDFEQDHYYYGDGDTGMYDAIQENVSI